MNSRLSVLLWNMGLTRKTDPVRQTRIRTLEDLARDRNPAVICLQETHADVVPPLQKLGFLVYRSGNLVTALSAASWYSSPKLLSAEPRLLAVLATTSLHRRPFIITNLHLASRMHRQEEDQNEAARLMAQKLRALRRNQEEHCEEIVAGDFNLEPFSQVLRQASGFFSNRCLATCRARLKTTPRPDIPLFNPSWQLLGSPGPPHGTYHYSGPWDAPWYVFDQILLSPDIGLEGVPSVQLVTEVAGHSLKKLPSCAPNNTSGSDHFPVFAWLSLGVGVSSVA